MNVTVLVDFENDSVRTALEVADALGDRLWGVRLDTSESLVDRSLWEELGDFGPTGVNPRLVWKVRDALDDGGLRARCGSSSPAASRVEKIREFEEKGVPVDAYGVGSSLIRGSNDFTADIVVTDGKPSAKVGRSHRENPRLELVSSAELEVDRAGRGPAAEEPLKPRLQLEPAPLPAVLSPQQRHDESFDFGPEDPSPRLEARPELAAAVVRRRDEHARVCGGSASPSTCSLRSRRAAARRRRSRPTPASTRCCRPGGRW